MFSFAQRLSRNLVFPPHDSLETLFFKAGCGGVFGFFFHALSSEGLPLELPSHRTGQKSNSRKKYLPAACLALFLFLKEGFYFSLQCVLCGRTHIAVNHFSILEEQYRGNVPDVMFK